MKTALRFAAICLLPVNGTYLGFSMAVGQDVEHNGATCSDGEDCNITTHCVAGKFPVDPTCASGERCVIAYGAGASNPISYYVCLYTGSSTQECSNDYEAEAVGCTWKYIKCECADETPPGEAPRCYLSDPNCICDTSKSDGEDSFTSEYTCLD